MNGPSCLIIVAGAVAAAGLAEARETRRMTVVEKLDAGAAMFAHESEVDSIAFSPDGGSLVAADATGGTTSWTMGGQRRWKVPAGGQSVRFVGSRLLVGGGSRGDAAYLDPQTGGAATPVIGASDGVSQAAPVTLNAGSAVAVYALMESRGKIVFGLALIAPDGKVLESEGELRELKRGGAPGSLSVSPDGRLLAVSDWQSVRVVEADGLKARWSQSLADALALDWSKSGAIVAAVLRSGEIVFLDAKSGRELSRAKPKGGACSICYGPGSRLAIGLNRGGVAMTDELGQHELSRLLPDGLRDGRVTALAFGPGDRIAIGLDRRLTVFEVGARKEVGRASAHPYGVASLLLFADAVVSRGASSTIAWKPSGERLKSEEATDPVGAGPMAAWTGGVLLEGAPDGTLRLRRARDLVVTGTILAPSARRPTALAVAPAAQRAVVSLDGGTSGSTLAVIDLAEKRLLQEIRCESLYQPTRLMLSPDGKRVVVSVRAPLGGRGGRGEAGPSHRLIDLTTGGSRELGDPAPLAFLDDDSYVARDEDGMAIVSLVGKPRKVVPMPAALEATVSPDGRLMAVAGWEGGVRVVRAGTLDVVLVAESIKAAVLAFGPDSRTLGAGVLDGSIRVWELRP